MAKTFVLDTSTLIASPYSIFSFDEHNVLIPDAVLEAMDKLRSRPGEAGAHANEVERILDSLRGKGRLIDGVPLPGGGTLKIEMNHHNTELPQLWDARSTDHRVLRVCKGHIDEGRKVVLVSRSMSLRIKAEMLNIPVEHFKTEETKSAYTGRRKMAVAPGGIDRLYELRKLNPGQLIMGGEPKLVTGEYLLLSDCADSKHTALACFDGTNIKLINKIKPYGVAPKNSGQRFAIDALMAPASEVPLVVLKGPAGTAKTFLALACGLEQTLNLDSLYKRILVARPNSKMDEDIGFLKGDEGEKIGPLIRPIMDNLEALTLVAGAEKDGAKNRNYAQTLFDNGVVTAQAMAYMRGRSVPQTYIIIDEAQNMSPAQAFGIVSRVGVNTKIVLTGDPEQIDNPYLDASTNGLCYVADRMKGSSLCRQVTFEADECVRSPLAAEAILRLSPKGYHAFRPETHK